MGCQAICCDLSLRRTSSPSRPDLWVVVSMNPIHTEGWKTGIKRLTWFTPKHTAINADYSSINDALAKYDRRDIKRVIMSDYMMIMVEKK